MNSVVNRFIVYLTIVLANVSCYGIDNTVLEENQKAVSEAAHLEKISNFTMQTAKHTEFSFWWDGFSIALSVVALLFSFFTFLSQSKTESNTRKLSLDAQHNLLKDLIRHLYRNLLITYTIKTKMDDCDYKGYPSEEHLTKLKVPMNNIHLEAFYGDDKQYEKMHKLFLHLRNYNEEIDIIVSHMSNPNFHREDLDRDLATLLFKPGFLIESILDVIAFIWKVDAQNEAKEQIKRAQDERNDNGNIANEQPFVSFQVGDKHVFRKIYNDPEELEALLEKFNSEVKVERGLNAQKAEKVYIIKIERNIGQVCL